MPMVNPNSMMRGCVQADIKIADCSSLTRVYCDVNVGKLFSLIRLDRPC